ncbi:hypothetical protein EBR96_03200, partial [bacterium]|nr:hypothetical protein [bacterium]
MKAPISTLTLSKNREFRQGLDAIGRKDMATATEKLRGLAVTAPEILPALLVPLYRLTIQSDEPIPIQLLIADLLTTCGWYTEAIHELEDILEERPDESPAFQLLSKIWSRAPQHIEIEGLFESAIEKGIFDSAILDVLPKMYLGRFDYEKSVALYQKLVDREPTAVHLQSGLANLLIKCQRYDDAIEVFEAVIRLSPLHATDISSRLEDMVRLAPDNIALRKALFKCYCKVCQPDRGVFHLEELLKWHPDRTDEVIDLLQEGLGLFPDTASLTLALARALVQKQSYSEAISYLQAVFVLPDHSYLPIIRNIAESILSIYPAQVYAMQLLADIEMAQSRLREALDYLEKITQFEHGEPHAIIERLVKIAKFSPDHKDRSHYITAKLYIQQRRYDDAISECQLLIGSEWDIPARLLAASASEAQGDISASETTLFSALET